jgi:hypothetical protein
MGHLCRRTASQARDVARGPRMTSRQRHTGGYGVDRCQAGDTDRRRHPLIGPDKRPLSPNQFPKPASHCGGWLVSFWAFPQGRDLKSAAEECSCQFGDRLARASQREAIVPAQPDEGFQAGEHVECCGSSSFAELRA